MIGDRYQLAYMQSDFYRNKYHKIMRAIIICLIIINLLILILIYQVLTIKNPNFYASTSDGRLLPMTPLSGNY